MFYTHNIRLLKLRMSTNKINGGTAHTLPDDLKLALTKDSKACLIWEGLTPLARNEWICWVVSVKKDETRKQHIERVCRELKEGMRRPCCWLGCIHRTDKKLSSSVEYVISKK